MEPYPHLFQRIKLGNLLLKNRIIMTPLILNYGNEDGSVSPLMLDHYRQIARGGVAMIVVEATLVDIRGKSFPRQIRIDDDRFLPGLAELARIIKENGSITCLQLHHGGRYATVENPLAPSAIPLRLTPDLTITPKTMRQEDIKDTVQAYAHAALRAKEAGFDLIELHGATGYLLSQFISPRTNKRTDEYGGSLENRLRFPLEIIKAIREKAGEDFPIGYRFMAEEWLPQGLELKESKMAAKIFSQAGISYFSVTGGSQESLYLPQIIEKSKKEGFMVYLAHEVKKETQLPIFTAGRILSPPLAEKILAEGKADGIALARSLFCDPLWPTKAKEDRENEVVKCHLDCDVCTKLVVRGKGAICPKWDREKRLSFIKRLRGSYYS